MTALQMIDNTDQRSPENNKDALFFKALTGREDQLTTEDFRRAHLGLPHVAGELAAVLAAAEDVETRLENFFSRFGEIRKISKFDLNGNGHFYAVDFTQGPSAVNAANATGCSKFGFNAVLVDPVRMAKLS